MGVGDESGSLMLKPKHIAAHLSSILSISLANVSRNTRGEKKKFLV